MKVLIVGGVAGGASAAARLRRLDEQAEIIMFERGEYISFANCGLPYYIGGEIKKKSELTLQTPQSFRSRFNVDVRTNSEVIGVDTQAKTATVKGPEGEYTESYDKLILSPGAAPLVPPMEGADGPRVFTLRNIPDTMKIRDFLDEEFPESAVVVGGGYIGVEMAENLKKAGLNVTIVELADRSAGRGYGRRGPSLSAGPGSGTAAGPSRPGHPRSRGQADSPAEPGRDGDGYGRIVRGRATGYGSG